MKETIIQKAITNYLQLRENQGELYFFRSGSGAVRVQNNFGKDRFFKSGKAGCPDIVLVKNGKFIGLEVKTEKGRQSENQKLTEEKIKKCGGEYYIVRSVEEVVKLGF